MITALALVGLVPSFETPRIEQFVQTSFTDATFVARKVRADQRELLKINKDFGQSYRFDTITIRVKEPFKLRLEAQVEDTKALYVVNGTTQFFKVPRLGVKKKEDLSRAPGRRQTLLDFGILTPSLFRSLFEAKFVRTDRATGDAVFDITFPAKLDDTTRFRVWIDPVKKIVRKREWYRQNGEQAATFYYENPKLQNGVWMPTRLTVKNVDDKVAGVTRYDSIEVNTGLSEDIFVTGG